MTDKDLADWLEIAELYEKNGDIDAAMKLIMELITYNGRTTAIDSIVARLRAANRFNGVNLNPDNDEDSPHNQWQREHDGE